MAWDQQSLPGWIKKGMVFDTVWMQKFI